MIYTNFEELFERFCIMTVDGKMKDQEAFNILERQTTPELFKQLVDKVVDSI